MPALASRVIGTLDLCPTQFALMFRDGGAHSRIDRKDPFRTDVAGTRDHLQRCHERTRATKQSEPEAEPREASASADRLTADLSRLERELRDQLSAFRSAVELLRRSTRIQSPAPPIRRSTA